MRAGRQERDRVSSDRGRRLARSALPAALLAAACRGTGGPEPPELPAPAPAATGSIDSLLAERRFRAALAEIDARLAEAPLDPGLLDRRIDALRALGLEREALAQALALRELAPDEARHAFDAGELAAHAGDAALAIEQFSAARALAPGDWRPAVGEAALRLRERPPQPDRAEELLAPWLEGAGARVEARVHHGLVFEARGDPAGARRAYERALELDPRHVPSLCNAARLAEAAGERERALELFRRAKTASAPDDERFLDALDRRIAALSPPAPGR